MLTKAEKEELIMSLPPWEDFAEMEESKSSVGNIIPPDFKIGFDKKMEANSLLFDLDSDEISESDIELKEKEQVVNKPKVVHGNILSNDSNFKPLF